MKKSGGGGDVQHVGSEHYCQAVRGCWCGSVKLSGGREKTEGKKIEREGRGNERRGVDGRGEELRGLAG